MPTTVPGPALRAMADSPDPPPPDAANDSVTGTVLDAVRTTVAGTARHPRHRLIGSSS